jgi:hypothetical protein
MKVVPDTVYWKGGVSYNDSWHNDDNWKAANNGTAFSPLRETNVVLPTITNSSISYPVLTNPPVVTAIVSESESTTLVPNVKGTPFIEYDYNFVPNSASEIYFKNGAELGSPYFLNYDSAKIDLKLDVMKWYGLSAPLRDMYSGDYSFERINPLAQMRLFNAANPQTNNYTGIVWTEPFNTANKLLEAGTGFGYNIGRVVFDLEDGNFAGEDFHTIIDTTLYFPKNKTKYQYYNESTKMPVDGKIDPIGESGRLHSKRFIYETGDNELPNGHVLVSVPTKVTIPDTLVVVGNPFMSHLDFAEFYAVNAAIIKPQYKLLKTDIQFNAGEFPSFVLGYGEIPDVSSVNDPALTRASIPPMQAFIVETTAGYNAATHPDLLITKAMSIVDNAHSALRSAGQEQGILRIKATRDGMDTHAVVALSDRAHNAYVSNEDSRRILSSQLANSPTVFTITDGKYLDINQMKEMPVSLPLGISTTGKGLTQITFTGSSSLPEEYDYFFFDKQTSKKIRINENTSYEFNNTEGDQIGRFYILSELRTSTGINEVKKNIQIYASQGVVHVLSSDGTEIDGVKIYSPDGSIRYQRTNTGRSHVEIPVTKVNPVLIVTATAGKAVVTEKVIVRN